eukprot:9741449-Karenia_brevis.AAC.1
MQPESRIAITLKHTNTSKEELKELFAPTCHYLCVGNETCKKHSANTSGGHLHAYLHLKEQRRVLDIYRSVKDIFQGRYVGMPEVWKLQQCSFMKNKQEKQNMDAIHWIRSCKKDTEWLEYGESDNIRYES